MKTIHLIPILTDYYSEYSVKEAFLNGKDFLIMDTGSGSDYGVATAQELKKYYDEAIIHYNEKKIVINLLFA